MGHLAQSMGSEMWPSGARQIDVLRWLSWDAQHFSRHASTLYFEYVIKPILQIGPVNEAAAKEAIAQVRQYAGILDDHLRDRTYLLGDALTIADFAVAATLPYAEQARIPLGEFPRVARWHDRLNELDAWREPFPKAAA
jgi:glutathione S-transferase